MAGGKGIVPGDTAVTVSARPGYKITRTEVPTGDLSLRGPNNRTLPTSSAQSTRRTGDSSNSRRGGGRGSDRESITRGGMNKRNKRRERLGVQAVAEGVTLDALGMAAGGSGTAHDVVQNQNFGRLDRDISPRPRPQRSPRAHRGSRQQEQHESQGPGGKGQQRHTKSSSKSVAANNHREADAPGTTTTTSSPHRHRRGNPPDAPKFAPTRSGRTPVTIGSPPSSPRNSLFRADDGRESRSSRGCKSDTRGAGRQAARAFRDAMPPPPAGEHDLPRAAVTERSGWQLSSSNSGTRSSSRAYHHLPQSTASPRATSAASKTHPARVPSPNVRPNEQATHTRHKRGGSGHGGGNNDCGYTLEDLRNRHDLDHEVQSKQQHSGARRQHAKGTCESMCPAEEMRQRQDEGGLSVFEATDATASLPYRQRVADPAKTVKKYRRSAAGRDMLSPKQLRPLAVLQSTAHYLVKDVFARSCETGSKDTAGGGSWRERGNSNLSSAKSDSLRCKISSIAQAYAFVEDRMRAVRQDLTVQGLALVPGAADVLRTAANFYVVAGYLMCDEPGEVFDSHLHTRELQGVFSSLADIFFQVRGSLPPRNVRGTPGADEYMCLQAVHALTTAIANSFKGDTQLSAAGGGQGVGRVFTTTVTKLCDDPTSFGDHPEREAAIEAAADSVSSAVTSPISFRSRFPKMAMAVRLLGAVSSGNWSEFFRIIGRASADDGGMLLVGDEGVDSPFAIRLRCLCHSILLPVRSHALRAMNKSFGKGEKVPLMDITKVLRMRSDTHAARLCRALSLPIEGETVVFKAVPAAWVSEQAKKAGHAPPSPHPSHPSQAADSVPLQILREDDWVGVHRALTAAATTTKAAAVEEGSGEVALKRDSARVCEWCAGFGCNRCEDGANRVNGGNAEDVCGDGRDGGHVCEACGGYGCDRCKSGAVWSNAWGDDSPRPSEAYTNSSCGECKTGLAQEGGGVDMDKTVGLWEAALCPG